MKKVQVLLSTFNGERFLSTLMNSLLNQDYPNVEILVRDDGSSDDTLLLLEEYANRYSNIEVIQGKNLGVVKSFFELLRLSSPKAEYIAFCDQDDVWEKDKISRAIEVLASTEVKTDEPMLYCGRLKLVGEDLSFIGFSKIPRRELSFGNALVENVATGCTIVINAKARDLIVQRLPSFALMHDWWIYLVVSAFGKVIYDPEPKVQYRQHAMNVIGAKTGLALWLTRIKRFLRTGNLRLIRQQAEAFREIYGSMLGTSHKRILDRFLDEQETLYQRIRYAFAADVYRQSTIDNIILKLLIVLNRL